MRDIRPGSIQDLVWNWGRAEVESKRFSQFYDSLSPQLQNLITLDKRDELGPADWDVLTRIVLSSRLPLLAGLIRLQTIWHTGILSFDKLPELMLMGWPPFVTLSPSRRIVDFVAALDKGQAPPREEGFLANYQDLKGRFEIGTMHGFPILVSLRLAGPYIILEGYSRLSVLTSKYLDGEIKAGEVQAVLGICDKLQHWYLNDDPRSIKL